MAELTKTENSLNELAWACSDDYGKLYYTFAIAKIDRNALASFRERDLFILRETSKRLPDMTDSRAVSSLMTHAAHMNTYEGSLACLELVGAQFKSEAGLITEIKASLETNYGQAWKTELGVSPFRAEEFGEKANIPDVRPFPKAPAGFQY